MLAHYVTTLTRSIPRICSDSQIELLYVPWYAICNSLESRVSDATCTLSPPMAVWRAAVARGHLILGDAHIRCGLRACQLGLLGCQQLGLGKQLRDLFVEIGVGFVDLWRSSLGLCRWRCCSLVT